MGVGPRPQDGGERAREEFVGREGDREEDREEDIDEDRASGLGNLAVCRRVPSLPFAYTILELVVGLKGGTVGRGEWFA